MLSTSDLGFFARNGFLHLKQAIDPETCRRLVDHTWTRLPQSWLRDDPSSWSGTAADSCHVADLRTRRGLFQFQKGDLLGHPVIEAAFSHKAKGGQIARQLIGHPLAKMRVRGLYCIVPLADSISFKVPARPHIESHPAQLISLCYLEDVAPGGGGLSVWPGSHRDIYPVMGSRLEHVATPQYDQVYSRLAALKPVELPGSRGDIVIIHHRLLHAPSLNRTQRIRYAFLCDYQRDDFKSLCSLTPSANMWEDWPAMAALPESERNAPPEFTLEAREGRVETVPIHSAAFKLSDAPPQQSDPSSIRKSDASALARSRRPGDKWLLLSDNPSTAQEWELYPRGSDLSQTGLNVTLDGAPLSSVCRYDFITRLNLAAGRHTLRIESLDRPAWLRVLDIRLPFTRTSFLLQKELSPGLSEYSFDAA